MKFIETFEKGQKVGTLFGWPKIVPIFGERR
jgi:hypothetical protein